MNYENFINTVKEAVEKLCPNDRIIAKKVTKNNSMELDSISVFRGDEYIAPTIYLDSYFHEFNEGKSIESIAEEIVQISDSYRGRVEIDLEVCSDFEAVKNKLFCKVVNKEQNKKILAKCPNRDFLDLSIVYYCVEMSLDNEYGSWLVTNDFHEKWGVSEEQLYETAINNMKDQINWEVIDIWDLLAEMTGERYYPDSDEDWSETANMYVLTNSFRIFGASAMLMEEVLKDFSKEHGNFFVLPSSIHELILIKSNDTENATTYKKMVEEVNETNVTATEYLSDEVYYYDSKNGLMKLNL